MSTTVIIVIAVIIAVVLVWATAFLLTALRLAKSEGEQAQKTLTAVKNTEAVHAANKELLKKTTVKDTIDDLNKGEF